MYAATPWLGRSGLSDRPTTAIVFEFRSSLPISSVTFAFTGGSQVGSNSKGSSKGNASRLHCAPRLPALGFLRRPGLLAIQLAGYLPDNVGNALVEAQALEIVDQQVFHQREADVERTLGVIHQVAHHVIILEVTPAARDFAEHVFTDTLCPRIELD